MFKRISKAVWNYVNPSPAKPPYAHVCQIGDPVLRSPAESVNHQDIRTAHIQQVVGQLVETMRTYKSYGLSAPQIGVPFRIIAFEVQSRELKDLADSVVAARDIAKHPLTIVINPVMKVTDYRISHFPEGCESLQGYSAVVPRFRGVQVSGVDRTGSPIAQNLSGWVARVVQHEVDHLNGVLYVDKMDMKTFQNNGWNTINMNHGKVKMEFYPRSGFSRRTRALTELGK